MFFGQGFGVKKKVKVFGVVFPFEESGKDLCADVYLSLRMHGPHHGLDRSLRKKAFTVVLPHEIDDELAKFHIPQILGTARSASFGVVPEQSDARPESGPVDFVDQLIESELFHHQGFSRRWLRFCKRPRPPCTSTSHSCRGFPFGLRLIPAIEKHTTIRCAHLGVNACVEKRGAVRFRVSAKSDIVHDQKLHEPILLLGGQVSEDDVVRMDRLAARRTRNRFSAVHHRRRCGRSLGP
mmetsp:Transcript_116932/g.330870  ORF Transcript_116932/g.330870 Transcript_116932/m.330870 type:complete len:238 (+) Transcript_116932:825-1538(+)